MALIDKVGKAIQGYLPEKRAAKLIEDITRAEEAHKAGEIPNAEYGQLRTSVNRSIELAWGKLMDELRKNDRDRGNLWILNAPQVHNYLSVVKTSETADISQEAEDSVFDFVMKFVRPIAELITELKSMVVKRQVKTAEERKAERYTPPPVSSAAMGEVKEALEKVTDWAYQELINEFTSRYRGYLDDYLAAQPVTLYNFYGNSESKHRNPEAMFVVYKLVDVERGSYKPGEMLKVIERADADATIKTMATELADDIRMGFVTKNMKKLASVIDKKGNFESITVVGRDVDMGGLRGEFHVAFADGSYFNVRNSVTFKVSPNGKPFNQFPLTFYNVVLPSGKSMKTPSEKKVNEEFAVAAPEPEASTFTLQVFDYSSKGNGKHVGNITPQVGMMTRMGKVVGFTSSGNSLKVELEDGSTKTIRSFDRLPGVALSEAKKWGFRQAQAEAPTPAQDKDAAPDLPTIKARVNAATTMDEIRAVFEDVFKA